MSELDKVINIALNEVGYLEKKTNANLDSKTANAGYNNYTKYARDLDAIQDFYNGKKNGYAWCFTEGTLILTDKGYKDISEIKIGDKVLNAFGNNFNVVTQICNHLENTIGVNVYGCIPIETTLNHPFLSQKRKSKYHRKKGYKEWGFNEIKDLNEKDVISIPKTPILFENILSYDEIWTIGYYVGDGYKNKGRYKLCANQSKSYLIEQHSQARKEKEYNSRTCIEYELYKKGHEKMFEILANCGENSKDKKVPKEILFGNLEVKKAFLDGYLSADGCKANNSFNSISKELITGLSRIIFDLGYGCSITKQERNGQGKIWDKRLNTYRYFNQEKEIYNCAINFNINEQHKIFIQYKDKTLVPIKSKKEKTSRNMVYTITTDGDHTYTANNLGVHNCDMFVDWCFVKALGVDRAKELLNQPNKSYGAGCEESKNYYKKINQFFTTPKRGDQIFFINSSGKMYHTGLVYDVDNTYVYTVEGNTSSASGVVENGGAVEKKKYKLNYGKIGGYGRPKYKEVTMEFNSGLQALDFLYMHDRITDKEYWLKVLDTTRNVEYLLIKWAEDFAKLLLTN